MKFFCKQCGETDEANTMDDIFRVRKLCYECRKIKEKDRNKNRKEVDLKCGECNKSFIGKKGTKYCSDQCRIDGRARTWKENDETRK